jgi:hypothetical protein
MVRDDYGEVEEHLGKGLSLFLQSGPEGGMAAQTYTWVGTVLLLQGADGRAERFGEALAPAGRARSLRGTRGCG